MESADRRHPQADELECFMRGELKRLDRRDLVRHLLTGCPRCLAVTRRLWTLGERSLHEPEETPAGSCEVLLFGHRKASLY